MCRYHGLAANVFLTSISGLCAGTQVLFRVRRPFYWISSTITVEDGSGAEIGEVRQRWHPWRRKYDLFPGHGSHVQ